MYKLIGVTPSRAFRVKWLLEELEQPYEQINATPRSPEALEHNPSGKIPALVDDGAVLTDSTAIMTYLADKHDGLTFKAGTLGRARQDSFTNLILDEFDAVLWAAARHSFILPEDKRVPAIKDTLKWEFAQSQSRLVGQMGGGPFLMGDRLTIADVLLGHCLGWAITAKFGISEPRLSEYLDVLKARTAYKAARAN